MAGTTMPPEHAHLLREGHLYSHEAEAHGWTPVMGCATCGLPVDLIWLHEPIDVRTHKGVLPGAVWGKDIAVLCRCCSRAGCPHGGVGVGA